MQETVGERVSVIQNIQNIESASQSNHSVFIGQVFTGFHCRHSSTLDSEEKKAKASIDQKATPGVGNGRRVFQTIAKEDKKSRGFGDTGGVHITFQDTTKAGESTHCPRYGVEKRKAKEGASGCQHLL